MRVCKVELNEDTSKYADYIRWFDSLDYEDQLKEFMDISRKSSIDFHRYAMDKPRKFGDAVERFDVIDDYLTNNNLYDKF